MNLKIWHKLAMLLLATTSLTIVISIGLSQQSFKKGFQDYLQRQEQRRLEVLSENLIEAYETNGNWDFLRGNHRLWISFLRSSGEHFGPGKGRFKSEPFNERTYLIPEVKQQRDFRPQRGWGRASRFTLLDSNKQHIVGKQPIADNAELNPLKHAGEVIAFIAREKRQRNFDRLDNMFEAQQNQAFIINTLVALIVSVIVALLASIYFRKRINVLTQIAQQLTSGQYEQRIEINQKDELGQLGSDFNTLAKTLQKNQQSQQQWIADISHELRTPVAILKGELEALDDGIRPMDKKAIQSLQQEIERLSKLIDDLYQLSISDMGALKYEKSKFDIKELSLEVYESFKHRFEQQSLSLNLSIPEAQSIQYHGDRQRLYQLLSNLLENSLRYTDSGGNVWIKLLNNAEDITLIIEDSAPGIDEDKLSQIFDRLFRLDSSRNRSKGGAGLGLAIAKQIVLAHQGDISANTSDYGGVKIVCKLPK